MQIVAQYCSVNNKEKCLNMFDTDRILKIFSAHVCLNTWMQDSQVTTCTYAVLL